MAKEDIIRTLETKREDLMDSLDGLSPEQMEISNAVGKWSIKDILSHLLMWEAQTVQLLFQARQGIKPTTLHLKQFNCDDQNDIWYQQTKDRPFDRVWQDFSHIREQTIQRLEQFSSEELETPNFFPWLKSQSLSQLVLDYTVEHDREHEESIRAWRKESNL